MTLPDGYQQFVDDNRAWLEQHGQAWGEKALVVTGAARVHKLDYQEPYLYVSLIFEIDGYEQNVRHTLDLSSGIEAIEGALGEMRPCAEYLIKQQQANEQVDP